MSVTVVGAAMAAIGAATVASSALSASGRTRNGKRIGTLRTHLQGLMNGTSATHWRVWLATKKQDAWRREAGAD